MVFYLGVGAKLGEICPEFTYIETRVSAALVSRNVGDRRVIWVIVA